jgi:hypothetical protein
MSNLVCKYCVRIYKGHDISEGSLFREISKCVCNMHTCCSVATFGVCGEELHMNVLDKFGHPQSEIKKIHNGVWNECCSAGDRYEVDLPTNEDDAALMLGALMLLDMLYFENPYYNCNP